MDANIIGIKAINEGISKGDYKITGVLSTGEVVLTLFTDLDKEILKEMQNIDADKEKILKKVIESKGRPALEWEQVFKQEFDIKSKRCLKNNLILKD